MAKLAVFCDGTWNGVRMTHLTNVARLARSVAPFGKDGHGNPVRQVVFYDEGVGVKSGVSRINDEIESIMGGAFGRGLDHRIEAAYRFIVMNYEPEEDEIYVFGFSRGAYTARSLCGLIRKCGILRRECLGQIPRAMEFYRDRKAHPAGPECAAFRAAYAHPQPTGLEQMTSDEREKSETLTRFAMESAPGANTQKVAVVPRETRERSVRIRYLGLWDTVGSLGVPNRFVLLKGFNRKYQFHDADASRLIENIRHAAAIDEDRKVFALTPIDNIHELNISAAAGMEPAAQVSDPELPNYLPYDRRPYQQKWFPGDHGSVGGGNIEPGLSSAGLLWVCEGAALAGLTFDVSPEGEIRRAERLANACAEFRIRADGTRKLGIETDFLGLAGGYAPRRWNITRDELNQSTTERVNTVDGYYPVLLDRITGKKRVPPHRIAAVILSPLFRVFLWVLAPVVLILASIVVAALGIGFEAMRADPDLIRDAVESGVRWLIARVT